MTAFPEARILRLRDGDFLLIETEKPLSGEAVERIKAAIKEKLGEDFPVLVASQARITVVRDERSIA